MDILLDINRLTEARRVLGLTQDELGKCMGGSRRLVQRFEVDGEAVRIKFDEINQLSRCLGIQPFQLWAEVPFFFKFEYKEITTSSDLALLLQKFPVDKLDVQYLPAGLREQEALIDLADQIDQLKSRITSLSHKEEIEQKIKIKNAADAICGLRDEPPHPGKMNPAVYYFISNVCEVDGNLRSEASQMDVYWCVYLNLLITDELPPLQYGRAGTRLWENHLLSAEEPEDGHLLAHRQEIIYGLDEDYFQFNRAKRFARKKMIGG
jgi:transcriptional regulator with XRE-family HTH domain